MPNWNPDSKHFFCICLWPDVFLQSYFLNRYSNGRVEQNQIPKGTAGRKRRRSGEEPAADDMSLLQIWQNAADNGSLTGAKEEWASFDSVLWSRWGRYWGVRTMTRT